ncbi:MAG: CAP domain-containing protein [Deltaproteobacteria bacterium]|nr:CAP domain-containing protein [Deltaproteobacteria bacterium]
MKKTLILLLALSLTLFQPLTQVWAKKKNGELQSFQLKQNSDQKLSKNDLRNQVEEEIFQLTNAQREKKNLKTLEKHPVLLKAARFHSEDMMKKDYFSHYSPEGKTVLERIQKFKKGYDESCGENLHQIRSANGLYDSQSIAELMMKDWIGSVDHRKNILSKEYTNLEVGCATDGKKIFCTQVFSGPKID